ncbi:VPS10 domain-containing protein [Aquimarina macrocephali]|uniref:VPS10 domain-containing protein n=1 Tax=Aquimarina macrocephali TaxID=666563 RepID=UPI003F66D5D3
MKTFTSSLFFLFLSSFIFSQQPATNAELVQKGLLNKKQMEKSSLVKHVPFKNIGPTVMSGRVVDVDVNPENTTEFYVGYASGGLWHTVNNGTTFEPVLDSAETINVGDIAVDWKNNIIWVGTGENNSSRSSYAGIGILKSTDNGKTWKNVGLLDSHHIGRIVINPNNPDEVVVGVTGHLYSSNQERGVYKTTDGGTTWKKTLFINDRTGIIDLAYAPGNYNVMYAAAWDKDRKAWDFKGNGLGSGIYKSIDAGTTWNKISIEGSGFPTGEGVGRIGLAVFDENTVYAVHDNQYRRKENETKKSGVGLTKEDFKTMSSEAFLKLENKKLNTFLKTNGFQEKYRADNVKQLVRSGTVKPIDLAKYLENANAMLFDTPVIGAEVYRSNDGGKSWAKTHEDYIDDLFYSYGYYFAQIQVSPTNKDHIYISGVPILKSKDAGKTFTNINGKNVHADHHSLWINPKNPMHLINGNDGGLNISYDDGENWIKANQPSVGQFYAINIDHEKPYNVYGGLQDNGVWVGAHNAKEDDSWHQNGHYPWESIMGGDGMQVQIDDRDANIVYTGFQFGNYFRIDREKNKQTYIQPKHELGDSPYRFNWQTPILLSPHNQDILYLGGNKLMRSMNQGDDWTAISNDLTNGGKKGNVAYGTLTTIAESIFQFGLIYTGSDDGLVYVTKNSGGSWSKISESFPKDLWVSRVIASSHKKGRVYVTLNGYRWDDFKPYIYVSENYGQSWKNIGNGLPVSAINVIKEDPKNENVVYIGTDNGAYVSLDKGASWQVFSNGLPNVAVHDIVIQPEANDLLLGTHGRSIYKTNIEEVQLLDDNVINKGLYVFDTPAIQWSDRWGVSWSKWSTPYEPTTTIKFYSGKPGDFSIKITTEEGKVLQEFSTKADKGLNYVEYDLTITEKGKNILEKEFPDEEVSKRKNGKYYLPTGRYSVEVSAGKQKAKTIWKIK